MNQDKDQGALGEPDDFKKLLAELEAKGKEQPAKNERNRQPLSQQVIRVSWPESKRRRLPWSRPLSAALSSYRADLTSR
jgi:hypothetical protein